MLPAGKTRACHVRLNSGKFSFSYDVFAPLGWISRYFNFHFYTIFVQNVAIDKEIMTESYNDGFDLQTGINDGFLNEKHA